MMSMMRRLAALVAFGVAWTAAIAPTRATTAIGADGQPHLVVYRVAPHVTDPAITRFDAPHYIVFESTAAASAPLFLFLSGTGGLPGGPSDFLAVAAHQGYRVIGLAYHDTPAVVAVCTRDIDPACSGAFRQQRIFGDHVMEAIDDRPEESIVNRLTKLLVTLDHQHPDEGWGQYLDGAAPRWDRITVAGHSQGAGMAAYLAQRRTLARVVLFSSPWDNYGPSHRLAPWIAGTGVTPPERWFAAYHARENTATLIARAYRLLNVPDAHIRKFTLEPKQKTGENPYHLSMVGNASTPRDRNGAPAYAADWTFLIGP
jgi:hypothetical protein